MPAREQLVVIMRRIYGTGMTTTSGGNLSVLDPAGDMWITPSAVDKGILREDDVVCVRRSGAVEGRHAPSSELPLHRAVYAARSDIRAVIHAHPCALVAFCIARKSPDTRILPRARAVCGRVGYTPYTFPASEKLGAVVGACFGQGHDAALLENHGVVTGGRDLLEAFQRLETLDVCAQLWILAGRLGRVNVLTDEQIARAGRDRHLLPERDGGPVGEVERALRVAMCEMVARAYRQRLMTSTEGTLSARLDARTFLVTPHGFDRAHVEPDQIVSVQAGRREAGKIPSLSVRMHQAVYDAHPEIGSMVCALAPAGTAFSVTDRPFDTAVLPESYVLLRRVPVLPYGAPYEHEERVAETVSARTPVLLFRNDGVLSTGKTVTEAYDRLEVSEFAARSIIDALSLAGEIQTIGEAELRALDEAFGFTG